MVSTCYVLPSNSGTRNSNIMRNKDMQQLMPIRVSVDKYGDQDDSQF